MASPIPRWGVSRGWVLSVIAVLSFACSDLLPIGPTGSNDGGPPGNTFDAPVAENIITPNRRDTIGRTCTSDVDCPLLTCVKPTDTSMGGGGPAHGYCSILCTAVDDPFCKAADGVCLNFAREGAPAQDWCVQTCRRGGDAVDPNKCRGRIDVACTPSAVPNGQPSSDGYCLPTCNGDADCGARRCDPSSGVCVDAVAGDPTGAACSTPTSADGGTDANGDESIDSDTEAGTGDTDAETSGTEAGTGDEADVADAAVPGAARSSDCAGVCLSVGVSTHVCAQRCTYGSPTACHLPPEGPIDGGVGAYSACLFVAQNGSTGTGDEAHCGQLCDTAADCLDQLDPGVTCNLSDVALKAYGHGFCDWAPAVADAGSGDP